MAIVNGLLEKSVWSVEHNFPDIPNVARQKNTLHLICFPGDVADGRAIICIDEFIELHNGKSISDTKHLRLMEPEATSLARAILRYYNVGVE